MLASSSPKKSSKTQEKPKKKIALALQGGGSYGAFTWGVIDFFLEDNRLEIESISGTSAGGMNAVALAHGIMKGGPEEGRKELGDFWKKVSQEGGRYTTHSSPAAKYFMKSTQLFFNVMQNFYSPYQFNPLNLNPLKETLEQVFDFKKLRAFKGTPKIFLCATHVSSGKLKIFHTKDLSAEVMMASACLPTLFQAVEVKGEHYWDGGFVGNPVIYPLIYDTDATDVVVVQLSVMRRPALPTTPQEIIDRQKEITYNACLMREMRSISFISNLMDEGLLNTPSMKRMYIHMVRNESLFSQIDLSSAMDSRLDFITMLYEEGRKTAKKWLEKNYSFVGVKTTAEIDKDFVE